MATRKRTTKPPEDDPAARLGFTSPLSRDLVPDDPTFVQTEGEPPPKDKVLKINEEHLRVAKAACALLGATNDHLAKLFGVSTKTIEYWIRENSTFFKAVRDGKDQYNVRKVEASLLQRAIGFEYVRGSMKSPEMPWPVTACCIATSSSSIDW